MKLAATLAKAVLAIAIIVALAGTVSARCVSLEMAQPLQYEIYDRTPAIDMGIFPPSNVMRIRSMEVAEPMQIDALGKNPTEEVREPLQCGHCEKNPTDAVKQPPQCDNICEKNPTQEVKEPLQCGHCEKNPSQAVREPLDIECCGPTMRFNLKDATSAEIAIYNVNGRLVRRLSEMLSSGESSLTWDGMDDRGSRAASGVYFAQVQANAETGKGKLVLVR